MSKFSRREDEKLIEMISAHSALFDQNDSAYGVQAVRDNIWIDVGEELNRTVKECKNRWKCIRDTYFRYQKKYRIGSGSAGTSKSSKWCLYNLLSFLDAVEKEKSSVKNIKEASYAEEENIGPSCSYPTQTPSQMNLAKPEVFQANFGCSSYPIATLPEPTTTEMMLFQANFGVSSVYPTVPLPKPNSPKMEEYQTNFGSSPSHSILSHSPLNVPEMKGFHASSPSSLPKDASKSRKSQLKGNNIFFDLIKIMEQDRAATVKKMMEISQQQPKDEDDLSIFFKSMTLAVKKLSPLAQMKARTEILGIVTKYEAEEIYSKMSILPHLS